mgnify:CR=1 FL=1
MCPKKRRQFSYSLHNCKIESGKVSLYLYQEECPMSNSPFQVTYVNPISFDFKVVRIENNNTISFVCDAIVFDKIDNVPGCNGNRGRRSTLELELQK